MIAMNVLYFPLEDPAWFAFNLVRLCKDHTGSRWPCVYMCRLCDISAMRWYAGHVCSTLTNGKMCEHMTDMASVTCQDDGEQGG